MLRTLTPAFGFPAAALVAALLLYDPTTPAYAVPKATMVMFLAAVALLWLRRPGLLWLIALAGLALAPLIAFDPVTALWGRAPRAEGTLYFAALLVLAGVLQRLSRPEGERLDRVLHVAGALLALSVLVGLIGHPDGHAAGDGGTLGNPNTAGAVLAALLVHATARGGRWRWLWPLYAAALLGTVSQAAWLALLVGLLWLLPAGRVRQLALGLIGAGAVLLFALLSLRSEPMPSAALRLELWGASLRALAPVAREEDALGRVRWLVGYGPEQQVEALERHRRPEQNRWEAGGHERMADRAHSLPLDLWLSFGVAGLAALAWMVRRIVRMRERASAAAALALLTAGLPGFFGPAEWLLLALWLARPPPESMPESVPEALQEWSALDVRLAPLGYFAGGAMLLVALIGSPAAWEQDELEYLQSRYRRLQWTPPETRDWPSLIAAVCRHAEQRPHDGEAALTCAQIAHVAGADAEAKAAAIRAVALRPARPRAWLMRLATDPDQPQPALSRLRACLAAAPLDPQTARTFADVLKWNAKNRPRFSDDPDYLELQRLLAPMARQAASTD